MEEIEVHGKGCGECFVEASNSSAIKTHTEDVPVVVQRQVSTVKKMQKAGGGERGEKCHRSSAPTRS